MAEVETKLLAIFQIVNDWLKYAETKNGGLLVACGAAAAAIAGYLSQAPNLSSGWKKLLLTSIAFFILSSIVVLISFLPRINANYLLSLLESWGKPSDEDNFYYFGHLCKYSDDALLDRLVSLYFGNSSMERTREQRDLACQIVINSRLTVVKLRVFTLAACIALIAGVLLVAGLAYEAIF